MPSIWRCNVICLSFLFPPSPVLSSWSLLLFALGYWFFILRFSLLGFGEFYERKNINDCETFAHCHICYLHCARHSLGNYCIFPFMLLVAQTNTENADSALTFVSYIACTIVDDIWVCVQCARCFKCTSTNTLSFPWFLSIYLWMHSKNRDICSRCYCCFVHWQWTKVQRNGINNTKMCKLHLQDLSHWSQQIDQAVGVRLHECRDACS